MRLLIELLRPAGAELARRWVSALLLVPDEDREAVVQRVEASIVRTYTSDTGLTEPATENGDGA